MAGRRRLNVWTIHYAAIESKLIDGSITQKEAAKKLAELLKRMPSSLRNDDLDPILQDLHDIELKGDNGILNINTVMASLAMWAYDYYVGIERFTAMRLVVRR